MRIAIVVVAVVAVLVVLAGGGAVYWVAGNVRVNDTVHAVNADTDKMNTEGTQLDALTKSQPAFPDLAATSSDQDFIKAAQQFHSTAQQYLAELDKANRTVADSRALLADAQRRVSAASGDWLTIPHRSRLDRERRSLSYEEQAIGVAQQLVDVARKQLQASQQVVDAMSAYVQLAQKLDRQDWNGAQADDTQAHNLLAQSAQSAEGAHMPAGWDTAMAALNKLVDDTKAAIGDLQKGDYAAAQTDGNRVEADGKALQNLDTSSFGQDTYLQDLAHKIQTLEDKSNALK